MNISKIPGYTKYANSYARDLALWAIEEFKEGSRIKASRLKRISDKLENKYRHSREFKRKRDKYIPLFRPEPPSFKKGDSDMDNKEIADRLKSILENSNWSATIGEELAILEDGIEDLIDDLERGDNGEM